MDTDLTHDWRARAACAGYPDPDAFHQNPSTKRHQKAAQLCTACPVRAECLDFSMDTASRGLWAGLTAEDRHGRKGAGNLLKTSVLAAELTGIRDRQICELTKLRRSAAEVAAYLNTNERTVGRVLKRHGLEAYGC